MDPNDFLRIAAQTSGQIRIPNGAPISTTAASSSIFIDKNSIGAAQYMHALPPGYETKVTHAEPRPFDVGQGEIVAIEPNALGRLYPPGPAAGFFDIGMGDGGVDKRGPVAVVSIDGPLMQKAGWFWDGYDAIKSRFERAMADTSVRAVVLKINSPGGMVAGCFETVEAMNRIREQSKKPVYAYADEMAASAAYALASVADEIWLPKSGLVGSVGVVITLYNEAAALEKFGIRVAVITTGKQKADGHAALPLTDDVIARFRERADYLNSIFVGQVAASREMSTAAVLGLEAGVFYGDNAIKAGLADKVGSFDEFMSSVEEKTKKVSPLRAAAAATSAVKEQEMNIENAAPSGATASLALIAATFGMSAGASERDVQARARELGDIERDLLRVTGKATAAEALGVVRGWQVSHEALATTQAELSALRQRDQQRDIDALIEQAKAEGKVTNEALEKTCREIGNSSPVQLRALLATLTPVGGGTLAPAATREPEKGAQLSATDLDICKALGVPVEEYAATRREELARKAG